jgi:phage terminase small subunit
MTAYDRLTPLRQRFVDEYLVDLNAAQAAVRAGSRATRAGQAGHEILTIPDVQQAIAERAAARTERVQLSADQVIQDIRRIGQSAEQSGQFAAALKAQEMLARHLGMFNDKMQLGAAADVPPMRHEVTMTPAEAYRRMLGGG